MFAFINPSKHVTFAVPLILSPSKDMSGTLAPLVWFDKLTTSGAL